MQYIVKHFSELTIEELLEIYKLRVSVFVVEQKCPYQEVDDADRNSYHIWFQDEDGIQAYARVMDGGVTFAEPSIGRIIAKKRRCGLDSKIVSNGIQLAQERFHAKQIKIAAQTYAIPFYEQAGFRVISEPFLDVGVPHVLMLWEQPKESSINRGNVS